ncbi:hypothetical protein [Chitinophaga caeni]|nr:hypothetical protein [Chitinophaga caeni]
MMKILRLYTCFFCLVLPMVAKAQQTIFGMISGKYGTRIDAAEVRNLRTGEIIAAGKNGNFKINVELGDRLTCTAPGFLDTLVIVKNFQPLIITMNASGISLKTFTRKDYKTDSLALRVTYGRNMEFKLPPWYKVVNVFPPAVQLNNLQKVLSFKGNKRRFEFKKRLLDHEREAYLEETYNSPLVEQYSGFRGDTLEWFMHQYRPSYEFLQNATAYDLALFIKSSKEQFLDSLSRQKNPPDSVLRGGS